MDEVFKVVLHDNPLTDWPMMSASDVSKMVISKLAEYESRWQGFPPDLIKGDCKAYKCLLNVVNYQLKKMRQQQDPKDADEAIPVPRLQINEQSSEVDHSLMGSQSSTLNHFGKPASVQKESKHIKQVKFIDLEPKYNNEESSVYEIQSQ